MNPQGDGILLFAPTRRVAQSCLILHSAQLEQSLDNHWACIRLRLIKMPVEHATADCSTGAICVGSRSTEDVNLTRAGIAQCH